METVSFKQMGVKIERHLLGKIRRVWVGQWAYYERRITLIEYDGADESVEVQVHSESRISDAEKRRLRDVQLGDRIPFNVMRADLQEIGYEQQLVEVPRAFKYFGTLLDDFDRQERSINGGELGWEE